MVSTLSHVGCVALAVLSYVSWRRDVFVANPARPRVTPMVDGTPLEVGSLVGYKLDVPGSFIHAGIYLGRGCAKLRRATGCLDLRPELHYMIEHSDSSGPTNLTLSTLFSKVGRFQSAEQSDQSIWITAMNPSTKWLSFEIHSSSYGHSHPGSETLRRALSKVGGSFGIYDMVQNNCQHFAVWARYGKKAYLLVDEGKHVILRHMVGMTCFAMAGLAGSTTMALVIWALSWLNISLAKTGRMRSRTLIFKEEGCRV